MPVQITITGENAKEALQEIGGLASALVGSKKESAAEPVVKAETTPKQTKNETKSEAVKESEASPETGAATSTDSADEGNIPTNTELRAVATEKAGAVGKAKVKALLDKYEVSNVTALPDDKRSEFLKELEELS